ncbi:MULTISPECIES: hypothetical protein [Parachlamydia]|jgi:hypothetical protein|uniref:hypothetical protein n=1 Tax=Parachlamydia TaxID=83551 RepID=UPI0001C17BB9|nr:hypothetical protein [Parachlamydia acanthamoebae]EFB42063.1 hypothetical protein pah_c016o128 [Parachlamydia acanthamoebae str. Hall's coccus]
MLESVVSEKVRDYEQKFVEYLNGIFEHGIVCSNRAILLGIKQVSSLDKNPRPPNEVEVNCISDLKGIQVAVNGPSAETSKAKGALSVALERKHDTLTEDLPPAQLTPEEEKSLEGLPATLKETFTKLKLKDKGPTFTEEALSILSDRANSSLLILTTPQKMQLVDNDGESLSIENSVIHDFKEQTETEALDGCREIKILANIDPRSFDVVLLPKRFEHLRDSLNVPQTCQVIFVPETTTKVFYNYAPLDSSDSRTVISVPLEVSCPNFLEAAAKYFREKGQMITHASKGPSLHDKS